MTGIALVTALLLMGTNLLTDVLYGFADPRVQLQA
jgi:ABC-type dipeptide/oligopeptide/nickel transport system permease component